MYLIVYDIGDAKRLRTVAKICERYVNRVQKSVFEGDLSKSQLFAIKDQLKKIIKKDEDSVIIYLVPNYLMKKKITLGKEPKDPFVLM